MQYPWYSLMVGSPKTTCMNFIVSMHTIDAIVPLFIQSQVRNNGRKLLQIPQYLLELGHSLVGQRSWGKDKLMIPKTLIGKKGWCSDEMFLLPQVLAQQKDLSQEEGIHIIITKWKMISIFCTQLLMFYMLMTGCIYDFTNWPCDTTFNVPRSCLPSHPGNIILI